MQNKCIILGTIHCHPTPKILLSIRDLALRHQESFLRHSYHSLDIHITHAGVQVEVQTPTNTMHDKHISKPQPMHNSGTMDVPHHVDSMTDSSESSDNDQRLFDIMESHDDSYNKVLCLFSMFVMNCFD